MYHNEKHVKVLGCMKRRKHWAKMPDRKIQTNLPDLEVPDNKISTSKYTKITFFPKNLFEQFSKLSNSYFLVFSIFLFIFFYKFTIGDRSFAGISGHHKHRWQTPDLFASGSDHNDKHDQRLPGGPQAMEVR